MQKNRLQELCHKKLWSLPEYEVTKSGPDHSLGFQCTVKVNNLTFQSQNICRSSKQAQNDAAGVAYLSLISNDVSSIVSELENAVNQPRRVGGTEVNQISQLAGQASIERPASIENVFKEPQNMYKVQLHTYLQKMRMNLPMYSNEHVGTPHAPRFKSEVSIGEKTFKSSELHMTVKEAEHAAAKVALQHLIPNLAQNITNDSVVYKNLLQEHAQKSGLDLPVYSSTSSGEAHIKTFVATVEVAGKSFTGEEARTKKIAEMNAAKVAYLSLMHCIPVAAEQTALGGASSSQPAEFLNVNGAMPPHGSGLNIGIVPTPTPTSENQVRVARLHIPDVTRNVEIKGEDIVLPNTSNSSVSVNGSHVKAVYHWPDDPSYHGATVVRVREPNTLFPPSSTVIPSSNEKWVAVKHCSPEASQASQ